ncbi:uncharacterized protein FFB14_01776 [Fusarium fujikuroi]|nr:uncharacterized protein FFB14_01776 [Fusarium fujikuroi]
MDNDVARVEAFLTCNPGLLHATYQYEITKNDGSDVLFVTPLALAVACQRTPVVDFFLNYGGLFDEPTPTEGWSVLHLAARFDSAEILSLLLAKNPEIDQLDNHEMTPLHLACRYGTVKVAELLLDAGANLDARNNEGCTPFHLASMYGQVEILELLWEKGPTTQMTDENAYSSRPLALAVINSRGPAVSWLVQHGADLSHPVDEQKNSILHLACIKGLYEMVELLLEKGANIHARDLYLNTPLLQACWTPQPRIFTLFRNQGALLTEVNKHGRAGFHAVVLNEIPFSMAHKEVLELLVGAGADINKPDVFGYSPLFHACRLEKPELIEILLDLGADIDQNTTDNGLSPLMEACCNQSEKPVEILLQRNAQFTAVNRHGLTALALACINGCLQHVEALLNKGADVAARDREGHIPLCTAANHGETKIMLQILESSRYLPRYPADEIDLADREIFMAKDSHDAEIEEHLLNVVEDNLNETPRALEAIMFWATAHGRIELARKCISRDRGLLQWEQNGATWLHVVAQHAKLSQRELITDLLAILDASRKALGQVTPLHLAASGGSRETTLCLLEQIGAQSPAQPTKAKVMAILSTDNRDASPLTISIRLKNQEITELFWAEIQVFGASEKDFMRDNPEHALWILETLAQYEKPGHEETLKHLLQVWFVSEDSTQRGLLTPLDWAVYCSQTTVVWWLLSKGGYSSYSALDKACSLVQYCEIGVRHIMHELLKAPPPVLSNISNPNADPTPERPEFTGASQSALTLEGAIVDIYSDGQVRSTHYANAVIEDIIYGSGADETMKVSCNLDDWHLNALKKRIGLRPSTQDYSGDSHLYKDLQLRWIHLPANEINLSIAAIHASKPPITSPRVLESDHITSRTSLLDFRATPDALRWIINP